jgi:hypothetical protein
MTATLKKKDRTHMHVQREFHDPNVVRRLEEIDEATLAELLEDAAFDQEIAEAVAYSRTLDGQEPLLSLQEFLAQECK